MTEPSSSISVRNFRMLNSFGSSVTAGVPLMADDTSPQRPIPFHWRAVTLEAAFERADNLASELAVVRPELRRLSCAKRNYRTRPKPISIRRARKFVPGC
jgi:hypothetical protein